MENVDSVPSCEHCHKKRHKKSSLKCSKPTHKPQDCADSEVDPPLPLVGEAAVRKDKVSVKKVKKKTKQCGDKEGAAVSIDGEGADCQEGGGKTEELVTKVGKSERKKSRKRQRMMDNEVENADGDSCHGDQPENGHQSGTGIGGDLSHVKKRHKRSNDIDPQVESKGRDIRSGERKKKGLEQEDEASSPNAVHEEGTSAQNEAKVSCPGRKAAIEEGLKLKPMAVRNVQEVAMEYLRLWSSERENWSFKKKTQYWLLQNMYDKAQVPKREFRLLLTYLEGLQGGQRRLCLDHAEKIVEGYGRGSEEDEELGDRVPGEDISKRKYKRAVEIMRTLA